MIFNMTCGSGGSGSTLTVTAPAGVTVTASKDGKTKTKTADGAGEAVFRGLESGVWTVTITDGSREASTEVAVNAEYTAELAFSSFPEFSYTGDYEAQEEAGGNWKIRLLSSGTLRFSSLNGAGDGIDVFLVGGGGGNPANCPERGGSSGGYTTTARKQTVQAETDYEIVVGAGGTSAHGEPSSAFGFSAKGGRFPIDCDGANGGSGGGAGWYESTDSGSDGGSDGQKAPDGTGGYTGGRGQGATTREFGEADGALYAGGGAGCAGKSSVVLSGGAGGGGNTNQNGTPNTGGGGGAARNSKATTGGSGIVIIRNAR